MHLVRLIPVVLILCMSVPAFAQTWTTYVNLEDRFSVNLPGEPDIEDITFDSEYRAVFPGRVYTYVDGANTYIVTVIDYTDAERIHAERTNKTQADSGIDLLCGVGVPSTGRRSDL